MELELKSNQCKIKMVNKGIEGNIRDIDVWN